ncbi:MAG: toprim domain-containing protein [Oscillospiraceae bacterium]
MPPLTDEQITAARAVDLLSYLQSHEPGSIKKSGPHEYCLREHDSLKISNGKWFWFSRGFGSNNALDFLIQVRGFEFTRAVSILADGRGAPALFSGSCAPPEPEKPKPLLTLPIPNQNNHRAIAYLMGRGISKEVINTCISRRIMYESRRHHNCVFVGKNAESKIRFACERGTSGNWKKDLDGSDKRFSFSIPARIAGNTTLNVYEAPVDMLSAASIRPKLWSLQHHLSLGGVSARALDQYLSDHPHIRCVNLCLDNDRAGRRATKRLTKHLVEKGCIVTNTPPASGKDYNAHLQNIRKEQKAAGRPLAAISL